MPSNNKCWTKQPKKKAQGAIHKNTCVVVHHNDIRFNNVPSFAHVDRKDHALCLRRHRDFEREMAERPEGLLHYALTGRHRETPREHLAFLIAKYVTKHHLTHEDFFESLRQQGGEKVLSTPNLLSSSAAGGGDAIVNLLALSDQTLWNLYVAVPEQFRPPERPRPPPREVQIRAPKRGARGRPRLPKITIGRDASGEMTATVETVLWACCGDCGKWRRLFNTSEEELPDEWTCALHPDKIDCSVEEEQMDEGESWLDKAEREAPAPSSLDASTPASPAHEATQPVAGEESPDEFGQGGF